ncbi:hypothetical protein MLD38_000608 [Melastoma candidum]|uniref:Uncharacterized protein n=1 Tax=Melastoma candidum TaxID=119954 RepID=A0ACB9SBI4_9MYRT|nr:hypothetical protein MLD38_000608 [Melastoma candidum]
MKARPICLLAQTRRARPSCCSDSSDGVTITSHKNHSPRSFSVSAFSIAMSKKVLVPVANGTEPIEAVVTIDVLRRAGADVTVASVEKQLRVVAAHGVKLIADAFISDCADAVFDLISLPGGMPGGSNLRDCKILENLVKKQAMEGRPYAAICASPAVVLGSWDLLKGATCYPSFMEQLKSFASAVVDSRVQVDGKVVTSRGPGTTMEYAVTLVELLFGKEKANEVAGPLVMRSNHADPYTIAEFNPVDWISDSDPQILVPIANGSEEMEAVFIIDVLRRAKAKVIVASVEDNIEVVASRKVKLAADMLLDEAAKLSYDLIVLPGGLGGAEAFTKSLVLEPHGLLKGKKATAFPAMCNKLSDQSEAENRVVVDGNLITSRGPGTSMEFGLAIVEEFYGRNKALDLAEVMLFTYP